MKIVVTSSEAGLDARVDTRFGRCPYFTFVDTETMATESEANSGASASGGAGIAAAQQIAAKKPAAVLTGYCGPNAFDVLKAAGITVHTIESGTVRQAVEAYNAGTLQSVSQANAGPHSGMGR